MKCPMEIQRENVDKRKINERKTAGKSKDYPMTQYALHMVFRNSSILPHV